MKSNLIRRISRLALARKEGREIPKWMGLAYWDTRSEHAIYLPLGLNFLVMFGRWLFVMIQKIRYPLLEMRASEVDVKGAVDRGYALGVTEGRIIEFLKKQDGPVKLSTLEGALGELTVHKYAKSRISPVKIDFVPTPRGNSSVIQPVVYLRRSIVIDGLKYASIPMAAVYKDKTIEEICQDLGMLPKPEGPKVYDCHWGAIPENDQPGNDQIFICKTSKGSSLWNWVVGIPYEPMSNEPVSNHKYSPLALFVGIGDAKLYAGECMRKGKKYREECGHRKSQEE